MGMKQRMREKLKLDIKSGRIRSYQMLNEFDEAMEQWLDKELMKYFKSPSDRIHDHKLYKKLNVWQDIDMLSSKQLSFSVNPIRSAKIVQRAMEGVTKQINLQNLEDQKRERMRDDIKQKFKKQIDANKEKQIYITQTFQPINFGQHKSIKQIRPSTAVSKRPSTAIRVNRRIARLSVPNVRGNRLDRFGFDNPDLCNVIVPKTINRLTECYEAVQNENKSDRNCWKRKSRNKEVGDWVQSEISNFEQKLKQIKG